MCENERLYTLLSHVKSTQSTTSPWTQVLWPMLILFILLSFQISLAPGAFFPTRRRMVQLVWCRLVSSTDPVLEPTLLTMSQYRVCLCLSRKYFEHLIIQYLYSLKLRDAQLMRVFCASFRPRLSRCVCVGDGRLDGRVRDDADYLWAEDQPRTLGRHRRYHYRSGLRQKCYCGWFWGTLPFWTRANFSVTLLELWISNTEKSLNPFKAAIEN